jgi:hypothetical protein
MCEMRKLEIAPEIEPWTVRSRKGAGLVVQDRRDRFVTSEKHRDFLAMTF